MSLAGRWSWIAAAATLAVSGTVHAQAGPHERAGLWFSGGFAYQRGCFTVYAHHCPGGPALALGVGWAVSDAVQLGLGSTTAVAWSEVEDEVYTGQGLTGVLRVHPLRRSGLLLTAGLGVGSIGITTHRLGLATEAGIGYDLRLGRRASLTPYLGVLRIGDQYRPTTYQQLGVALTLD